MPLFFPWFYINIYIYVNIYIFKHVYKYICIYINIYLYKYIYLNKYVYIYINIYIFFTYIYLIYIFFTYIFIYISILFSVWLTCWCLLPPSMSNSALEFWSRPTLNFRGAPFLPTGTWGPGSLSSSGSRRVLSADSFSSSLPSSSSSA